MPRNSTAGLRAAVAVVGTLLAGLLPVVRAAAQVPREPLSQRESEWRRLRATLDDYDRDASGSSAHPAQWALRLRRELTQAKERGLGGYWGYCLIPRYFEALRRSGLSAHRARALVSQDVDYLRALAVRPTSPARAPAAPGAGPFDALLQYVAVLWRFLDDDWVSPTDQQEALRLARVLEAAATRDPAQADGMLLVRAAHLEAMEGRQLLRGGRVAEARVCYSEAVRLSVLEARRALRYGDPQVRHQFPKGWEQTLGFFPQSRETPWRTEAAWRLRRALHEIRRAAEGRADSAGVSDARLMRGAIDYECIGNGAGSSASACFELRGALEAARAMPPGAERDVRERDAARGLMVAAGNGGDLATARDAAHLALEVCSTATGEEAERLRFHLLSSLGDIEAQTGLLSAAGDHLRGAEQFLAGFTPDMEAHEMADSLLGSLGDYYCLIGDTEGAPRYYHRAVDEAPSCRHGVYELQLAELRREELESRGLPLRGDRELMAYYKAAFRGMTRDPWLVQTGCQAKARRQELLGARVRAEHAWTQAIDAAVKRQSRPSEARLDISLGRLLLESRRLAGAERARRLFEAARQYADGEGEPYTLWQALLGRGEAREQLGDVQGALADFEQAARTTEQIREESALSADAQARMLPDSGRIYQQAVRLLLAQHRETEAYGWVQRYNAQVLRRVLQGGPGAERSSSARRRLEGDLRHAADLRLEIGRLLSQQLDERPGTRDPKLEQAIGKAKRRWRDATASLRLDAAALPDPAPATVSFGTIQRLAAEQRLGLVNYLAADDRLLIFLITGSGLKVLSQPLDLRQLNRDAWALREACSTDPHGGDLPGPARGAAERLYAQLIAPLKPYLLPERPLVVVPDGPLHGLPFAALMDRGNGGRFLVEERPVGMAASLDLLAIAFRQPALRGRAVVLARSYREQAVALDVTRSRRARYGWLPGALAEADGVAGALHAVSYLDKDADRHHFRRALSASVLWFVGHVDAHDPASPALVLAGGREGDIFSLRDLVATGPVNRKGLEMAVVSGCQSAAGPAGAGEGLVGLAWALQQAGARSVVGCLWDLDDHAGQQLMTGFAQNLGRGVGRAEALQSAQIALMANPAYRHPYYWASPVLFGRSDALGPLEPPASPWKTASVALLVGALVGAGAWAWRRRRRASRYG